MKLKILGEPHDEVLMMTHSRYKHYKSDEDQKFLRDGLLHRKYFGETGSVKYAKFSSQNTKKKKLSAASLHGDFGKHPGFAKTIAAYRAKFYFLKRAQLFREWVLSCEQGIRGSPTLPCKISISTLLHRETPCKLICCQNYLFQLAMKIFWQPWTCFPATFLHTQHLIRTLKPLLKFYLTSWLSPPTYQRHSFQIKAQPLCLT